MNPSKNNKKWVKLHTIKSKIKIAKYAKSNTIKEPALKFKIPRTTINDWIKNLNNKTFIYIIICFNNFNINTN